MFWYKYLQGFKILAHLKPVGIVISTMKITTTEWRYYDIICIFKGIIKVKFNYVSSDENL